MQTGARFDSLTPREFKTRVEAGERLRLIDVREPLEHRIAWIEGAEPIPLGELPARLDRFAHDEAIVVMCHHGIRSATACEFLVGHGYTKLWNLSGGIDRWSVEVDPSVPRY